jgi:hypothetical protein
MASVLNRITKQFIASANTPDYPTVDWIINPDMTAVAGQPPIYWIITGDIVSLMDQAQRDAVDAQILEANRDTTSLRYDDVEDIIRATSMVTLDEINVLRNLQSLPPRTIQQMKTAVRNKLGT